MLPVEFHVVHDIIKNEHSSNIGNISFNLIKRIKSG